MTISTLAFKQLKYRLPLIVSIAAHAVILILLIVAAPVSYRLNASGAQQPIVHAAIVNTPRIVETPAPNILPVETQKKAQEEEKFRQLQKQAEMARQAKQIEAQRVQQQKALVAAAAQAKLLEAQRLEKLKEQQAQKLQEQQAAALAKKKQQEEAQAKILLEKQKQQAELAEKQKALQQQLLQQQLINEQQQVVQAQQMQGVIDQYRARILMAIRNRWLIPEGADETMFSVFTIDLTPEGVVSHVQLARSSGNTVFDRAAETAIYKASPLPVPKDPSAFNAFRHFTLKMIPQDIQ